jgi:hypothetical protein
MTATRWPECGRNAIFGCSAWQNFAKAVGPNRRKRKREMKETISIDFNGTNLGAMKFNDDAALTRLAQAMLPKIIDALKARAAALVDPPPTLH